MRYGAEREHDDEPRFLWRPGRGGFGVVRGHDGKQRVKGVRNGEFRTMNLYCPTRGFLKGEIGCRTTGTLWTPRIKIPEGVKCRQ